MLEIQHTVQARLTLTLRTEQNSAKGPRQTNSCSYTSGCVGAVERVYFRQKRTRKKTGADFELCKGMCKLYQVWLCYWCGNNLSIFSA